MASLTVYDRGGKEVGTYEVDPTEFAPRINRQLLHDVVVMYQSNRRQGSAKTKTRSEVSGSTKKLYRQKGTGNARAGHRRSGVRRGGGHIFAKRPRDFSYRLPRKAIRAAARMAFAAKIMDGEVTLLDDLGFEKPATKEMVGILRSLGVTGKALIATADYDVNVYRSGRNIQGVRVSPAAELNAFTLLDGGQIVATRSAMDAIKSRLLSA